MPRSHSYEGQADGLDRRDGDLGIDGAHGVWMWVKSERRKGYYTSSGAPVGAG